ncbi:hypothetical protein BGY98DRAFT_979374 [Russula aff. rugulosa BPL654]|nr:hypothetical protein BGY98DRAFT_979374 [Russula aff. rugulosa BPL654]
MPANLLQVSPNTASPSAFTCLLRGNLDEFLPYIGQKQSKWLIDISHDICDPTQKRGSLKVWDVSGERWRDVNPTDPPTASTYLYFIWAIVSLTKISKRKGKSKTKCWVTRATSSISNGHVCPKRMGDNLLRVVYRTFVSSPPPPALSVYDEICGITLSRTLDGWFDIYDKYICHSFLPQDWPQDWRCTIYGGGPPQLKHARNTPPGLLRWHYLQCLSLKMEGDSEDEGTDSECEWPSAALDCGRAMEMAIEDREARKRVVAEWAPECSSSLCP